MAQTPQAGTDGTDPTVPPAGNESQGFLGNPMTLLLIALAAAFLYWNMRRRRQLEERLQTQRREQRLEEAQRSAMDVANVMRNVSPAAARAAATEGLASAATLPAVPVAEPPTVESDGRTPIVSAERAEGDAAAERAAAERAQRLAQEAETSGRSEARRQAAAAAAAAEVDADSADAERARASGAPPPQTVPDGAIVGDGTTNCSPDFPIKGNASSRIYHEPGQGSYAATIAEFCFASAAAAEAAGFRQSRARGQRGQE